MQRLHSIQQQLRRIRTEFRHSTQIVRRQASVFRDIRDFMTIALVQSLAEVPNLPALTHPVAKSGIDRIESRIFLDQIQCEHEALSSQHKIIKALILLGLDPCQSPNAAFADTACWAPIRKIKKPDERYAVERAVRAIRRRAVLALNSAGATTGPADRSRQKRLTCVRGMARAMSRWQSRPRERRRLVDIAALICIKALRGLTAV
jgi:hypothetical protein